jgi:hypothetical protein
MTGKSTADPPGARAELSPEVRQVLACIDRGGLHISKAELRYQLRRRGIDTEDLLERLLALEERGLIESALHFRLTDAGLARLPDDHASPARVGTPSAWAVG